MAAAYKGVLDYQNESAPLLAEYNTRMRLAEMGFTFPAQDLSYFKAKCFDIIGQEIQKQSSEELKAKSKSKGRSGNGRR